MSLPALTFSAQSAAEGLPVVLGHRRCSSGRLWAVLALAWIACQGISVHEHLHVRCKLYRRSYNEPLLGFCYGIYNLRTSHQVEATGRPVRCREDEPRQTRHLICCALQSCRRLVRLQPCVIRRQHADGTTPSKSQMQLAMLSATCAPEGHYWRHKRMEAQGSGEDPF